MKNKGNERADGVLGLAQETMDAFRQLIVQHLKLARLEIKADLRAMGIQAGLIALLAAVAVVGYGLVMAGLAFILAGGTTGGTPLILIGVAHMVAAGVGIHFATIRMRRVRLMNTTAGEVSRNFESLEVGTAPARDDKMEASRGRS